MTELRKLPLTFQFMLAIAALTFSYYVLRLGLLAYGLWQNLDYLFANPDVMEWSSLFTPVLYYGLLATLSCIVFLSVLYERPHHPDISFAFLVILVALLLWKTTSWVMYNRHMWNFDERYGVILTSVAIRLACLAFLGWLACSVFPKTKLQQIVGRRHA